MEVVENIEEEINDDKDEELGNTGSAATAAVSLLKGTVKPKMLTQNKDWSLSESVYSIMFIADLRSKAFVFSFLVYLLKMALFALISVELWTKHRVRDTNDTTLISVAKFLSIPVAIAIQEDLVNAFQHLSNITYSDKVRQKYEEATIWWYRISIGAQLLDGLVSLAINFRILLNATEVLTVFMNFAALQFLQSIDDIGYQLAMAGYLYDEIESVAKAVKKVKLPKQDTNYDSYYFCATWFVLLVIWYNHTFQ